MAKLTRVLYKTASTLNMIQALTSGNPKRVSRYLRNRTKARLLARIGFWR